MNKDELFDLADYIAETYPFITITYFQLNRGSYIGEGSQQQFALFLALPSGEQKVIQERDDWNKDEEQAAAAWAEWTSRTRSR